MELLESLPSVPEVLRSFPLLFVVLSIGLVIGMRSFAKHPRWHAVFRCFVGGWWVVGLVYLSRLVKGDSLMDEGSVFAVSTGLSALAIGLMFSVMGVGTEPKSNP